MRSYNYILIIRRDIRLILHIPHDLSLFDYRRGYSEECDLCAPSRRVDSPGTINEAERSGWMGGPHNQRSAYVLVCVAARGGDLNSFRIYISNTIFKS